MTSHEDTAPGDPPKRVDWESRIEARGENFRAARHALYADIAFAVPAGHVSERAAAARSGLDRATIRRILGKR